MENATKALIIAGAILVAILLIGLGVLLINSTGAVTDQATSQTDSMALQSFNGQFTSYERNDLSASQVKALNSAVKASNASNSNQVSITLPTEALKTTSKYTAKLEYDNGYVKTIIITTTST